MNLRLKRNREPLRIPRCGQPACGNTPQPGSPFCGDHWRYDLRLYRRRQPARKVARR